MTGQRLGRYRLERLLGQGGMGQVWLAHTDPTPGRPSRRVALKLLPAELAADPTYRSRFEREAELAARLHDRHIVPIHAHGELDGRLFIEMEYVEGDDLSHILRGEGRLPPARAVDVLAQTATALDAAHRAGLVHRDVKPSNIVVRRDGFVYLIDFGIAHGAESTALTASGLAVGTWGYMAPERFTGRTDARADVYSLGCVLYECLAGVRPFGDTDPARQMHDHLTTTPPSVRELVPAVPARLAAAIARALAKDPADRYPGAGEFARAAAAALDPHAPAEPPPPPRHDGAEHPGIRHYGPGAVPVGTRRYEPPDHPATHGYESPSHPATRRYENAAPPGPQRPHALPTRVPAPEPARTRSYTRHYTRVAEPEGAGHAPYEGHRPIAPHAPPPRPGSPPAGRTRTRPGAPPRRRKRRFPKVLLWLFVLVGIPVLLIGGCAAAVLQGLGSVQVWSGGGPPVDRPPAAAGDPVRDGSFEFVVRNVESVPTVGFDRADGVFVVVSLTVRNIAQEPKTYTPLRQELRDRAGGVHGPDVTATAQRAATTAAPQTLPPGAALGTHLVYDLPAGTEPESMIFRDFPLSFGTSVPLG